MITEDHNTLLFNEVFYRAAGFTFEARPKHSYFIRMTRNGRTKLINLMVENYLPQGTSGHAITPEHIGVHENRTKQVKDKLTVRVC